MVEERNFENEIETRQQSDLSKRTGAVPCTFRRSRQIQHAARKGRMGKEKVTYILEDQEAGHILLDLGVFGTFLPFLEVSRHSGKHDRVAESIATATRSSAT